MIKFSRRTALALIGIWAVVGTVTCYYNYDFILCSSLFIVGFHFLLVPERSPFDDYYVPIGAPVVPSNPRDDDPNCYRHGL